jgi:hypothetical protein
LIIWLLRAAEELVSVAAVLVVLELAQEHQAAELPLKPRLLCPLQQTTQ